VSPKKGSAPPDAPTTTSPVGSEAPPATAAPADGTTPTTSEEEGADAPGSGEEVEVWEDETPDAGASPPRQAPPRRPPRVTAHWELHQVSPTEELFVARRRNEGTPPSAAGALAADRSGPSPAPGASPPARSEPSWTPPAATPRVTDGEEGAPPGAQEPADAVGSAASTASPVPAGAPPAAWQALAIDESDARRILRRVQGNIGNVVIGYEGIVRALLVALTAQGHILLEGVPGLAKTYLVRSFARSLALSFHRIQFTPDMLPADILGTVVLDPRTQKFEFRPGPIFAHVILADEINRAPPKVQSALLEAMQERQVTIEGVSHPLPSPFVVIATENPVELEGTYPLPEAELDRFLFRIILGYPSAENELKLLKQRTRTNDPTMQEGVLLGRVVEDLRARAQEIFVSDDILRYIAAILRESRNDPRVLSGASPRAGVQLLMSVKAAALFAGRDYAIPDDVKDLAFDVLNHRLILRPEALAASVNPGKDDAIRPLHDVVFGIVNRVAVPW
jgi:MoxR-like ATPase